MAKVETERFFGNKGIIIMIRDGNKMVSAIFKDKKNADKFNRNKPADVKKLLQLAKKTKYPKPVILMGYWNLILQFNENKFIKMCKKSGVSGLIIVDLPHPENRTFAKKCKKNGIVFVQLLSPTTSKSRMKKIIKDSDTMIYYISQSNTTGGKLKVAPKDILKI